MRMNVIRSSICALLVCGGSLSAHAAENMPIPAEPQPAGFIAHEWGTLTSVQGSDGKPMYGMHHEEEPLPAFVQGRACPGKACICPPGLKCIDFIADPDKNTGINQALETPVIYMYSPTALSVDVHVDFPRGLISQWYPEPTAIAPAIPLSTAHIKQIDGGAMTWRVNVLPPSASPPALEPVEATSIWSPARQVKANLLETPPVGRGLPQVEKFIFYRGVGQFETPFVVTSAPGEHGLKLTNQSLEAIPAVFLLRIDSGYGAIKNIGAIGALESVAVNDPPMITRGSPSLDQFREVASSALREALVRSGLYEDEARALLDTWARSYFGNSGLRVLYVMPRAWADRLLPITITPAPRELVRTMVGRVEVLTAEEEQSLLSRVRRGMGSRAGFDVKSLGRLAEPKLRRLQQVTQSPEEKSFIRSLLRRM